MAIDNIWIGPDRINPWSTILNLLSFNEIQGLLKPLTSGLAIACLLDCILFEIERIKKFVYCLVWLLIWSFFIWHFFLLKPPLPFQSFLRTAHPTHTLWNIFWVVSPVLICWISLHNWWDCYSGLVIYSYLKERWI